MANTKGLNFSVGEKFESFAAFKLKLEAFQQCENVLYVKGNCRKLPSTYANAENLIYDFVRLECKQGTRRKSESKGIRPNQRTIKCGCTSYIRLIRTTVEGNDVLSIKAMDLEHQNHPVDDVTASVYPENRRVTVTETVKAMVSSAVPNSQLRAHIKLEQSKHVLPQDIRNLCKKLLRNPSSNSEGLERLLEGIRDEGGVTKFVFSENGDFQYLFYVTKHMREYLNTFSDVLVIDTTYKVSKYLYPLVNVLCIDAEGCGRPVLHGFLRVEQREFFSSCLEFLKSVLDVHPAVFFVDKDFAEVGAVWDAFPETSVKFCAFHAANAVRKALQNLGLSSHDVGRVLHHFMEQRDTVSQEKYLELQRLMQNSLSVDVVSYFEDHWWNIADMWAAHTTLDLQTFHITTTNHVESYHSKLKQYLDSLKTFADCLAALLSFDRDLINTRNINTHIKSISHQYNTTDSCPAIQTIKHHLSTFASKVVVDQLLLARSVSYRVESLSNVSYKVTGGVQESQSYETSSTSCTCSFFCKFDLPCRHMFAVNINLDVPVCDVSILSRSRFCRNTVSSVSVAPVSSDMNERVGYSSSTSTQEGRYRLVSSLTSQINSLYQVMGERCFQSRLQELQTFFDLVRADRHILILDASNEQLPHLEVEAGRAASVPSPSEEVEVALALSSLPQTSAVKAEATSSPGVGPSHEGEVTLTLSESPQASFAAVLLPKVKRRERPKKRQSSTISSRSRNKRPASISSNVLVNKDT